MNPISHTFDYEQFQLSLPLKLLAPDDQLLEIVGVHCVVIVLVQELLQVLDQHLQPGVLPPKSGCLQGLNIALYCICITRTTFLYLGNNKHANTFEKVLLSQSKHMAFLLIALLQ